MRRIVLASLAALAAATTYAAVAFAAESRPPTEGVSKQAADLHYGSFVMDLHTDTLLIIEALGYDFGKQHWPPLGFMPWMGHVDIPRAEQGGMRAMFLGIVANPFWGDGQAQVRETMRVAHAEVLERYRDKVELAWTAADFKRINAEGKIAVQFLLEGAHGLGDDPAATNAFLDEMYAQGLRVVGLAHFTNNPYAASSASSHPDRPGLSPGGRALVKHMNEIGLAIDLAHVHPDSFREAVTLSTAPVIVSHTGVAARKNVFRNLQDWEIKAVAKTGGVIGVMYAPTWLGSDLHPPISEVVAHMRHIKDLVGAKHIALGSDFDGFIWLPKGMWDVRDLPKLTQAMLDGGFTPDEVRGILGENTLRVLGEIEARATVHIPRAR